MNNYPIFIASKGRPECPTYRRLKAEGCENVFVVVEPQDLDSYMEVLGDSAPLMVLNENNKGISWVRNHILKHARASNLQWFWMMDDDIKEMYLVEDGKCIKSQFGNVLLKAEKLITNTSGSAIGALEYQQYAWAQRKPQAFDSYCDVAVLINVEKTRFINYRENCKEDRDFVLQILSTGMLAVRSTWTAFSVPKNGSNKGGLHEAYAGGLENHWSARMIKLWPGVCEMNVKADGRPDVKIHWKKVKPKS